MTESNDSAGKRRKRQAGASEPDLIGRIVTELRHGDRQRRTGEPTVVGSSALNTQWRDQLLARLERGDALEQIDRELRRIRGLSEEERAALWLLAWGEQQRCAPARRAAGKASDALPGGSASSGRARRFALSRDVVVSTLELARAETSMDVAALSEIHDGREVVRLLAGEAESFGLAIGASLPVDETYCQRLLEGRLDNVVRDAMNDERVRDLEVTRVAGIGAYIGVPLTTLDARLYILCCLAHEQRPALDERDVVFLRGLGETITRELDTTPVG